MKRIAAAFVLFAAASVLGACCHAGRPPCRPGAAPAAAPGGSAAIYWCGSVTDGVCSKISTAPGTCPDGTPMNAGHVVWTEGTTAFVCTCGADCGCKIDPNDRGRCGCGKPIRHLDLAGTGIYFCNCGGACGCNTISSRPGACRCGMQLHQAK